MIKVMKQKKIFIVSMCSCAAMLLGVVGCGGGTETDTGTVPQVTKPQTVQEIQANPNMPPAAKAAAIAAMQGRPATSQAASSGAKQKGGATNSR